MQKLAIESKLICNESLFELKNSDDLKISHELRNFLCTSELPWKSLGSSLTQWVQHIVSSVPIESRLLGNISPLAFLENPENIVICKGAIVEPGAYISGPSYIAENAVVRHGAYIRGSVYISEGAIVGHTTECKGSIFLPFAKAAHFNYVGDSILGYECNLGAGTKLANLKINHTNIVLHIDGKKLNTELKKFGAILGNRAQTGCNSVTNPGTIMLPETILLPNQTALGIVSR